jgi:nucleoside-diphosphate kinase
MVERTLVFIKPHHIHVANEVLDKLDIHGKRVVHKKIDNVPKITIEEHYGEHKEKDFFHTLVKDFADQSVVLAIYEGQDVVKKVMDACGPTLPTPGTIRGEFSDDTYNKADSEGRSLRNVVHRSDSPESADKEIKVWEKHLED